MSVLSADTLGYMMFHSDFPYMDYMSFTIGSDILSALNTLNEKEGVDIYDPENNELIFIRLAKFNTAGKREANPVGIILIELRKYFGVGSVPYKYVNNETFVDDISDTLTDIGQDSIDNASSAIWKILLPVGVILYLWKK